MCTKPFKTTVHVYFSIIWMKTKGELHPERKEAFEKAHKAYEKLLANTSSLAVSMIKVNPGHFIINPYPAKLGRISPDT